MKPLASLAVLSLGVIAACNVTDNEVAGVPIVICQSGTRDVHCQSVPTVAIGSGPSLAPLGGAAALNSGFLDDRRLVVGAATGYDAHGTALGGIIEIDLTSRSRRVVLGAYQDAARGVVRIETNARLPFTLGPVHDVQRGALRADGTRPWFAVGNDGLFAIEPDVHAAQILSANDLIVCDGISDSMRIAFETLAVDGDDRVLLVANDSSIVSFDPRDRSCRLVTSNAAAPGPAAHAIHALRFERDTLWALDDASVFRVDLATGERTRTTSPSAYGSVGSGASVLGGARLHVPREGDVWTAGNGGLFVRVDDTGARTRFESSGGPSTTFDIGGVWSLPDSPVLVATAGSGVVVANVFTGSMNWLSR